MEGDLQRVKRHIQEAETDLEQAQECGARRLEMRFAERLRLLLEEKKRLTTGFSYTSPLPFQHFSNPHSTNRDSFRKKLILRSQNNPCCEICLDHMGVSNLEATRVIDAEHQRVLDDALANFANVPVSVHDTSNGLLLCPNCHSLRDKGMMQITGSGTIRLCNELREKNYRNLHSATVPWAKLIGKHVNYPTKELLELALHTKPAPKKHLRELIEESEEKEEENEEEEPRNDSPWSHRLRPKKSRRT